MRLLTTVSTVLGKFRGSFNNNFVVAVLVWVKGMGIFALVCWNGARVAADVGARVATDVGASLDSMRQGYVRRERLHGGRERST